MAGAFKFELKGVKELVNMLTQLPTVAMQKGVVKRALLKAGQPVADEGQMNATSRKRSFLGGRKSGFGRLARSIKVSAKLKGSQNKGKQNRKSALTIYVGSTSPLAHLIEFGTTERKTKEGASRGFISPQPFMRPAWDRKKDACLKILAKEMEAELLKAARRLATKAAKGKLGKSAQRGLMT